MGNRFPDRLDYAKAQHLEVPIGSAFSYLQAHLESDLFFPPCSTTLGRATVVSGQNNLNNLFNSLLDLVSAVFSLYLCVVLR